MQLHGSVQDNLVSALRSARRLRAHPVHADTLSHWTDLLRHARRQLAEGAVPEPQPVEQLVAELETELSDRQG
jgi:hypothetical protein